MNFWKKNTFKLTFGSGGLEVFWLKSFWSWLFDMCFSLLKVWFDLSSSKRMRMLREAYADRRGFGLSLEWRPNSAFAAAVEKRSTREENQKIEIRSRTRNFSSRFSPTCLLIVVVGDLPMFFCTFLHPTSSPRWTSANWSKLGFPVRKCIWLCFGYVTDFLMLIREMVFVFHKSKQA